MKIIIFKFSFILIFHILLSYSPVIAQTSNLPLLHITDLEYEGAFIVPPHWYGPSNANYAAGIFALTENGQSFFFAGHNVHAGIAEFWLPELNKVTDLEKLNTAEIKQDYYLIFEDSTLYNPQALDRISGMKSYGKKLIVNAVEYYDAPANNTHTTFMIENADDLANTPVHAMYELEGAAHAAGWISEVPLEWHAALEAKFLAGSSSKFPIAGRASMGPSAFLFDINAFSNQSSGEINTTTLLDFDLNEPLYSDYGHYENAYYNLIEVNGNTDSGHTFEDAQAVIGGNHYWTAASQASVGFIVPGTATYMTIGSSGGHQSGIGYKATQNNGNLCGGPCAYDAADYQNYFWLWDVNEMLEVKNGIKNAYDLRPYAYGPFDVPFQYDVLEDTAEFHPIVGGDFDAENNLLYLTVYDGAGHEGTYDRNPVVVAYQIDAPVSTSVNEEFSKVRLFPNPASDFIQIDMDEGLFSQTAIFNSLGQLVLQSDQQQIAVTELKDGAYCVQIALTTGGTIIRKMIIQ